MANWTPGVLWPSWPGSITTGDLDLSSTTTGVALEFIYGWLDPGCSLFALWDALVEGPPQWRPTRKSRVIARGITSEPLMITLLASRSYGSTPSLWRGKVLGDLIWLPIIQSGWVHALAIGGLSAGKSPAFRFIVLLWTKSRFEQHGSGVSKNVSKRWCIGWSKKTNTPLNLEMFVWTDGISFAIALDLQVALGYGKIKTLLQGASSSSVNSKT